MKIGVFVGSFNPVHNGHIHVVNYLLEHNIVDKVLIIPTLSYWDKNNLAPLLDRINMLKFFENDKIIIDEVHMYNQFTYQVMDSLEKDYPNDEFNLEEGKRLARVDLINRFNLAKAQLKKINAQIAANKKQIKVEQKTIN